MIVPLVAGMAKFVGGGRLDSARRRREEDSLGAQGHFVWLMVSYNGSRQAGLECRCHVFFLRMDHSGPGHFHRHREHPQMAGHRFCGHRHRRRDQTPTSADFTGIIHETVDNPKKLFNAAAAVGFRNLTFLVFPRRSKSWCAHFSSHVMDGATDELFTDS